MTRPDLTAIRKKEFVRLLWKRLGDQNLNENRIRNIRDNLDDVKDRKLRIDSSCEALLDELGSDKAILHVDGDATNDRLPFAERRAEVLFAFVPAAIIQDETGAALPAAEAIRAAEEFFDVQP